jgi:DNA modification methylase
LKIEQVKLDALIPYARNSRTHSDAQVAQIAASIKEFGFTNPVLIDETGSIIAGHGRVMAARKLAITDVPSIRLTHLTDAQKKAYVIADNKLALNAGWDDEMLAVELSDLKDMGFDLDLTGFSTDEIEALLAPVGTEGLTDEDAVPEVPEAPVTVLGDVWLLGKHRVMCGDSTSIDAVDKLMNGQKAALMQTDPPYGIAYVKNAKSKGQGKQHVDIENDDLDGEKLQEFLEEVIRSALPSLNDDAAYYLWHPMLTQGTFFAAAAAAAADILIHRQIIWCKPSLVFGRGDYHWQHELCFYGWRRGNKPPFYGPRNQTTLWKIGRETNKSHPTAKPVELWNAPIENHTKPGMVLYEPFSGSGSQIIAAEKLGRKCYAMELSPQYVDLTVQRWQEFTGQTATLESNGNPFISLKKAA